MADNSYESTPHFGYTVAPRVFSQIALRTLPHAICTVREEGASGRFDQVAGARLVAANY